MNYSVEVSYMEIYCERVRDLLNPSSANKAFGANFQYFKNSQANRFALFELTKTKQSKDFDCELKCFQLRRHSCVSFRIIESCSKHVY